MRRLIPYLVVLLTFGALIVVAQLSQLEAHHGSCATDAETCDVDYSGYVDSVDVGLVRSRFGMVFGTATPVPIATATATFAPASTQTPASPTATASPPPLTPTPSGAGCTTITPRGALPPAVPIWCNVPLNAGPSTFVSGANSWRDEFNHGLVFAEMGAGYVVGTFDQVQNCDPVALHFRHNNHWMTDINGCLEDGQWRVKGGATMRPDRTFTAEGGLLVVETEGAPDIATYDDPASTADDTWMEMVVTTGAAPTGGRDGLYAYDAFPGHWTFGCRMQSGFICAIYDSTSGGSGAGARRYEISFFQCASTTGDCFGGSLSTVPPGTWKECNAPDDPDVICRNKFRFELTSTSVTVFVNGVLFFRQRDLPPFLGNLVNGQAVFVYMADVVFGYDDVARFHWDRIAVNP